MRRLILVRHAEAAWGDPAMSDHERPLTARGHGAARLMGAELARLGCVPELAYASAALRTRQTWEGIAPTIGGSPRCEPIRALYLASKATVLHVVAGAPPSVSTLMVVGHNPVSLTLTLDLARTGDPALIELVRRRGFPTATAAVIDLASGRWDRADRGGALRHFVLARALELARDFE